MLVLHANHDLETTFQTLIKTMGVRVEWNQNFVIMGDLLILEGAVRSLYFQFDNRQVITNIIELDYQPSQVLEIEEHPKLANLLNIVLYAFGKWGTLAGVKVDKDYDQLNLLFKNVMKEYYIEPIYRKENFRFYKDRIRITYEDIFELAIEAEERPAEEPKEEEEEENQGLWHSLIWEKRQYRFQRVQTTLMERLSKRLGHNFYMVGYRCPSCTECLHMTVYPVDEELRIETEEKGVYIARAYTCDSCNSFYTPRPGRLLIEGDIYEMAFGPDRKAYEDYLELLGATGDRTSNYKFNEYEALRNRTNTAGDILQSQEEAIRQMEDYLENLDDLPDELFSQFMNRIEDNFYPDALVEKHEPRLQEQILRRQEKKNPPEPNPDPYEEVLQRALGQGGGQKPDARENKKEANKEAKPVPAGKKQGDTEKDTRQFLQKGEYLLSDQDTAPDEEEKGAKPRLSAEDQERMKHYSAHLGVVDRMSARQKSDLRRRIENDAGLGDVAKKELLRPIEKAELKEKLDTYERKTKDLDRKTYAQISRIIDELEEEPIPREHKEPFFKRLFHFRKKRGEQEVKQMMSRLPKQMDRSGYQQLEKKLSGYPDVDLTPYKEDLKEKREHAETEEIAAMIGRARKTSRDDYTDLMMRLEEQQFADENVTPYMEKLQDKLRELDKKRLEELCGNVAGMDYNAAMDAYGQIEEGSFLPELKEDALKRLSNRLAKLKSDECQLLVEKFKGDLKGKIKENPRFHFYPAQKVYRKEASKEETAVIDYALASYAGNRNLFEYPILVVDTSRNHSGKEGMVLTPEHLYYSTMLSAYRIAIPDIDSIKASTGLLNRKITIEEKNTTKHKLPYAVGNEEMKAWAKELEQFIYYLQERPQSRQVTYLAKEKHETICCYRCGFVYHGSNECPKCGYKKNR